MHERARRVCRALVGMVASEGTTHGMQARTSRHPRGAPESARPAAPPRSKQSASLAVAEPASDRGHRSSSAPRTGAPRTGAPRTGAKCRDLNRVRRHPSRETSARASKPQARPRRPWPMVSALSSAARAPLRVSYRADGPADLMLHRRCRDEATRPTAAGAKAQYTRRSAFHNERHRGITTSLRQPQMIVEQSVSFRNRRACTLRDASECSRYRHAGRVENRGAVEIAPRTRACPARGRCPICQRTIAPLVPPRMPRTPCAAHPSHRASRAR